MQDAGCRIQTTEDRRQRTEDRKQFRIANLEIQRIQKSESRIQEGRMEYWNTGMLGTSFHSYWIVATDY